MPTIMVGKLEENCGQYNNFLNFDNFTRHFEKFASTLHFLRTLSNSRFSGTILNRSPFPDFYI